MQAFLFYGEKGIPAIKFLVIYAVPKRLSNVRIRIKSSNNFSKWIRDSGQGGEERDEWVTNINTTATYINYYHNKGNVYNRV